MAVRAAPDNAVQNDGTIYGRPEWQQWPDLRHHLGFVCASAPAEFKTDVEEAFQFYADEFDNPITLYYTVGFGEEAGGALSSSDLGYNTWSWGPSIAYSNTDPNNPGLLQLMTANASSSAQKAAVASLPANDPTNGETLSVNTAELKALGYSVTNSASSPDDQLGISDTADFSYDADPDQLPAANEYDIIGTLEHEISEGMGRVSGLNIAGANGTSTSYSPLDLFRFLSPNNRALSAYSNPSYFSINDGTTPVAYWNNYTSPTGNNGDLGDWDGCANSEYADPTYPHFFSDGDNSTPEFLQ